MFREKYSTKSNYEIQELLGEGLTSKVYKAIRRDFEYGADQVVALKVLKSKKLVSVLRNEFHQMLRINSHRCVRVYAWEALPQGPALVMEYISGKTLAEILTTFCLSKHEAQYVVSEVGIALKDLKQAGLFHGDLNLKNIFLTTEGKIKLIDFGFRSSENQYFATPEFMAPERWKGAEPTYSTDLFSLGLIEHKLLGHSFPSYLNRTQWLEYLDRILGSSSLLHSDPNMRKLKRNKTQVASQSLLAQKVNKTALLDQCSTKAIEFMSPIPKGTKARNHLGLFVITLAVLFFLPQWTVTAKVSELHIRTKKWFEVRVNEGPWLSSPVKLQLPDGEYSIEYRSWRGGGVTQVAVNGRPRIQLNDSFFETTK